MKSRTIAILPCAITLGNAMCGFAAITLIAGGDFDHVYRFYVAAWLIFFGMIFDAMDGWVARMTRSQTPLGAELDSLSDVITFGVAPALLSGRIFRELVAFERAPKLSWIFSGVFAVCAILRLARYNVKTTEEDTHEQFEGLPTPAASGVVAGLVLLFYRLTPESALDSIDGLRAANATNLLEVLPIMAMVLGLLMMSRIPYAHMFSKLFGGQRPFWLLTLLIFSTALFIYEQEFVLIGIFALFALSGPVLYVAKFVTGRLKPTEDEIL